MPSDSETAFGGWSSPITSEVVIANSRGFRSNNIKLDNGVVFWNESRSSDGRVVICSVTKEQQDSGTFTEWTPDGFSARTSVHEYGGAAFLTHQGSVYFSNQSDHRLYHQASPTSVPVAVTPAGVAWRYADGEFANFGIYCVRENHDVVTAGTAKEPENSLVFVNLADQTVTQVARGADFYASPRVSPDGKKLVWLQWVHPNMPWDSTEIWQADLDSNGLVVSGTAAKILGENDTSYMHPTYSPNGKLFYTSDQTNWWNLYGWNDGAPKAVVPRDNEQDGPHWSFCTDAWAFETDPNGTRLVVTMNAYKDLYLFDQSTGKCDQLATGYQFHNNVQFCSITNRVYFFGGAADKVSALVAFDLALNKSIVIRPASDYEVPPGYLSVPTHMTFPTSKDDQDSVAHGYYYPPMNPDYSGPKGTLPPLLILAHGGPTGCTFPNLALTKLYYTSRGFAVFDVNYRGSTGYGRIYRNLLREQWGIFDVDDCCHAALHLVKEGKVDGQKLCVTGGSAGGYLVLAALTFRDVFHVGVSHYGISDLIALEEDTHKFEGRYNTTLIGPYPAAKSVYQERSPINYTHLLKTPVAVFQGTDDKIVPPNQSEMLFSAVKDKGLPTAFVLFEGEGHGFRKGPNIRTALDGEYFFFCSVLGIRPSVGKPDAMEILNLPS